MMRWAEALSRNPKWHWVTPLPELVFGWTRVFMRMQARLSVALQLLHPRCSVSVSYAFTMARKHGCTTAAQYAFRHDCGNPSVSWIVYFIIALHLFAWPQIIKNVWGNNGRVLSRVPLELLQSFQCGNMQRPLGLGRWYMLFPVVGSEITCVAVRIFGLVQASCSCSIKYEWG